MKQRSYIDKLENEKLRKVPPLGVELRPYQHAAINSLFDWFDQKTGNPLIVLPTGSGKSMVLAGFIHAVLESFPTERILVLTHVKELVAQNHKAMLQCWPDAPAGICSAGLNRREHDAPILFAGIQSVFKSPAKIGWTDLVIIDEAHLIGTESAGMYQSFLNQLHATNSKLRLIGLTATPFRTGEGLLHKGQGKLFDGVAYSADLAQLIKDGWLCKLINKGTQTALDVRKVHKRAGEFIESELEEVAMATGKVVDNVDEIVSRSKGRKAWLIFACSIKHAEELATVLAARHKVSCATVFGDTPRAERDEIVADFRAGKIRAVVNVNVLTTGFDAPMTDLIVLLRPTCSPVLFVQMVGRGLRPFPGKADCLVLDFGNNMARHGPIDCIKVGTPRSGDSDFVFARECPECRTLVNYAVSVCPDCGFEWAVLGGENEPDVDRKPDEKSMIIAGTHPTGGIEKWRVGLIQYRRHQKSGRPPVMCVEYLCGFQQRVREWVCFEHIGYPKAKARTWWREHLGPDPMPETVDLALCLIESKLIRQPKTLTVDIRGEYPEIKGKRFEEEPGLSESDVQPAKPSDEQVPF